MRRAVQRERRDLREIDPLLRQLPQGGAERRPPVGRLLLAPAGMVMIGRKLGRGVGDERARSVQNRHLAPAGAVIYSK